MSPPRARRREATAPHVLVVAACVAAAALWGGREHGTVRARIEREDAALEAALRVASAETLHREATGAYGWIDELEAAGRLDGLDVAVLDGRPVVRTPGYRLDVLLPMNDFRIVPKGGPEPPPDLRRLHFAVVARPVSPGVDGYRIWYLDERGAVYATDGVTDPESLARNALPDWPVGLAGTAAARLDEWHLVRPAPVP